MQTGLPACKHWLGVNRSTSKCTASTALTSCLSHLPHRLRCPWGQGAGSHAGPGSGWGPPCRMWLQHQHTREQQQQGRIVKESRGCAVDSSPATAGHCTQLQTSSSAKLMKRGRMCRLLPLCRGYVCAHAVLCARLPHLCAPLPQSLRLLLPDLSCQHLPPPPKPNNQSPAYCLRAASSTSLASMVSACRTLTSAVGSPSLSMACRQGRGRGGEGGSREERG